MKTNNNLHQAHSLNSLDSSLFQDLSEKQSEKIQGGIRRRNQEKGVWKFRAEKDIFE